MKKIQISRGLISLVSDVDYQFVSNHKWYFDGRGYARNNQLGSLHRIIICRMLQANIPSKMQCDHINRDKLDNRRENLRLATRSENQVNSGKKIGKTGFRGVYKQKDRTKWRAQIMKDQKRIFIGHYNSKEDAAKAYNQKAKELFGEYAYLNKI